MKKQILIIVFIAIYAILQGCSIFSETGVSKENKIPFSVNEYQSDMNYYRALGKGKSPNLSFAKEIALHNAKENLAKKIFHNNPYNEMTENVINQNLIYVDIVRERVFKLNNGYYSCWVIVETPKEHY